MILRTNKTKEIVERIAAGIAHSLVICTYAFKEAFILGIKAEKALLYHSLDRELNIRPQSFNLGRLPLSQAP